MKKLTLASVMAQMAIRQGTQIHPGCLKVRLP